MVTLIVASPTLKPVLRKLLDDYLTELAAFDEDVGKRGANGHVDYQYFDDYWGDTARFPLAIYRGDDLAGFCLLRDMGTRWGVAEFYVLPAHRRQGVGAEAVQAILDRCRADGRHTEIEADTLLANTPALAFWRGQSFVNISQDEDMHYNIREL